MRGCVPGVDRGGEVSRSWEEGTQGADVGLFKKPTLPAPRTATFSKSVGEWGEYELTDNDCSLTRIFVCIT